MHQIVEIAPGIVFFVSYFFFFDKDIYWATGIFMIALAVQFIIYWLFKLKISKLMWFVFVVGMVAGTITIVFQMPIIIKWRPTAISWALSAALLSSLVIGRRNVLKWLFEDYLTLPERLWNYQSLVLGIVFFLSGTTNIVVAYSFAEQTWMLYKGVAWIVWPILSTLVLGIVFWVEHRRTGGAIFEQVSTDTITQKLESSERKSTL